MGGPGCPIAQQGEVQLCNFQQCPTTTTKQITTTKQPGQQTATATAASTVSTVTITKATTTTKPLPHWQDCTNFSTCSKSCGTGVQQCTKTCINGSPGDNGCPTHEQARTRTCSNHACLDADQWMLISSQNSFTHDWTAHCTTQFCTNVFDADNSFNFAPLKHMPVFNFKFVYTDVQGLCTAFLSFFGKNLNQVFAKNRIFD